MKLPILPSNKTPPWLRGTPIRRYRLLPRESPAYAWIDLVELRPGYWTSGYATGLRRERVGLGCHVEHAQDRWPNAHNAWFARLLRIDRFWRGVPQAPPDAAAWIEYLCTEDFEGLFAPWEITFLQ